MATPMFFPNPVYTKKVQPSAGAMHETIASLCEKNSIPCRMTGQGSHRQVYIEFTDTPFTEVEPFNRAVRIGLKPDKGVDYAYRYALALMGYLLHDLAAKESIRGHRIFSEIEMPEAHEVKQFKFRNR